MLTFNIFTPTTRSSQFTNLQFLNNQKLCFTSHGQPQPVINSFIR
ncbi:hypothetical protein Pint_21707 [Pistacia integerrima]|uniref:Uncharacterized protein n=1 Tax=Pistacia integerrima TaxID=434235 RepID=A0ACC0XAD0_9ROSI|nr:hypothetical protein Pint_21707 [Pistacia integerrima]